MPAASKRNKPFADVDTDDHSDLSDDSLEVIRERMARKDFPVKQVDKTRTAKRNPFRYVTERCAPWNETWHADFAPVFPFGETIFASNILSLEIDQDLSLPTDPEKRKEELKKQKEAPTWRKGWSTMANRLYQTKHAKVDGFGRIIAPALTKFTLPDPDTDVTSEMLAKVNPKWNSLRYQRISDPDVDISILKTSQSSTVDVGHSEGNRTITSPLTPPLSVDKTKYREAEKYAVCKSRL